MKTTLRVAQANCPFCFDETLDVLRAVDGVRQVDGSSAGPCIEIDHDDVALDVLVATVRRHLHGVEMMANEIVMVPVEPVAEPTACAHHAPSRLVR